VNCLDCKYHQRLYYIEDGEYYPSKLFRCTSHKQKASYSKRVMADGHRVTKDCRYHSGNEVDDRQIRIEV
jgi:hypothetical protein